MKISHKNFQLRITKTSIFAVIALASLVAAGCNHTIYLSLTENNKEQIVQKLSCYEQYNEVGIEVTSLLRDGEEIGGELLSVKDSMITICTKHSATDFELANLAYPIISIRNNEIKELTLKGNNLVWISLAIVSITSTGTGIWMGQEINKGLDTEGSEVSFGIIGFLVGAAVGGIVGYFLSTDDTILSEIPPDYNFCVLKLLARYKGEEPEYLKEMK